MYRALLLMTTIVAFAATTTLSTAIDHAEALSLQGASYSQPLIQDNGCENGLPNSFIGFNASRGRCFGH